MSVVTKGVSEYVRKQGINLTKMAREIEVPYVCLYDSLLNDKRDRELRADEFMKVCKFLRRDPKEFAGDLLEGVSENRNSKS